MVLAQPPEPGPRKTPAPRTKPQVIYHLPPSSDYAATLHSQAKGPNNDLPIDDSMPASLQLSRANANAAAAQSSPQPEKATPPLQESRGKRPKQQLKRSQRSSPSIKAKGRGNSHGNPHKK